MLLIVVGCKVVKGLAEEVESHSVKEAVEASRHTRTASMWKYIVSEACDEAVSRLLYHVCHSLNSEVKAQRLRVYRSTERPVLTNLPSTYHVRQLVCDREYHVISIVWLQLL